MKKKFTNIVVFLAVLLGVVIGMPVWSQNLVVNPSFENTSSCPIGISEFSKALNWSPVNSGADTCSSPDLYAACAPNIGGANSPNALIGFQNSRTGSHHAGIILYEGVALFGCNPLFSSQYREYIEGQVSSPLVAGQKYCVKFYVSLANCKWGSDDIGIYFTNTLAQYNFCNNDAPLPVTPQLNWCSAAVMETEDWAELRWTYTANGGENYFVIGNFKNDNNTSIEDNNCGSIHSYAYYFIDDVSITPGCCPVDMAFTNIVQPTCGSNNGSINLGVANSPICGENGSVSYLWSNGATTKNVANLAANTYTVTVTNQGGCTATLSTVLSNGGCCPTVVTINTTAATCGANNGSISAVVSNNPVAPSYLWLNNATTASVSNVPPGTYTVTVTTGAGCVVTASGTVVSSIAPTPPVIPPQNVCNVASTTLNAGNGYSGYTWSASNGGTISSATNAQGVIVTSSGTYTVVVTAANGCTASTQTTVVINTLTASASANSPCIGGVLTLSATGPAGATYSWAGSNGASSSQQNPSINNVTAANSGTYTVTVTGTNGCTTSAQTTVSIGTSVTPTFTPIPAFCSGTAAPSLPSISNNGIAGTWSPTVVSNTTSGTYAFTPNAGQCASAASLSVTVNPSVTPTFTPIPAFCSGTAAPTLPSTSNNGIAGTWLPTVVSNTTSGTYNFTPNAGQCASAVAVTTTVNPSVTPTFTPIPAFCSGTTAPSLPSTSNNGIAGTWVPTVVSNTTSGTYAFTPNAGQCASATSLSVTVNPSVSPTFTPIPAFCSGTAAPTLPSTSNNGIAGTWLPTVVSNTTSGTYNFTPNAGQCASAAAVTTTVNPSVTPTFTPIPAFCSGTVAPTLPNTSNNGIVGTWLPTVVSNTTSGTYNFTPNAGQCASATSLSVTVNPSITPTFTPILAFCSGTAAPSLPNTSNNGVAGTWSPTTISNTTSGTYNFTPNAGQCASAASLTVTVNPSVTPTFTPITAFCSGTAAPTLPSTSNNGIAGAWLPTVVSNTTSGTYAFTPNAGQCASAAAVTTTVNALPNLNVQTSCGAGLGTGSITTAANASAGGALSYAINGVADADGNQTNLNNGTYTVLITENPSTCTAAQTVSVNCNCPSIVVNGALSICQNTAATYTQTGGNAGGQWAVSPSGAGAVDANGNFVPSGGFSGAASISYAANGCTGNLSININPLNTPSFTPILAFCSGTTAPTLPSMSNNGIAGTWLPTVVSNTTSGTYNFTPNAGQCASVAAVTTTVNALPNLSVTTSCGAGLGTGSVATTANASAGGALSYAINGVADADGNQMNLNNGTYTVLITENPSTCTAAQTVSVNCNCPTITIAGALSICQNGAATYTQIGGNAGGQWSVSPSGAGTVDANGNFVPSGGFSGAASISYAANGCTGNLSISINPLTTPTFTPILAFCSGTAAPSLPSTSNNGIAGTWSPTTISNTTSGTYNFTPNAGQCASAASLSVTINALPNLNVQTSCGAGLGTGSIATTANTSAGGVLSYAINGVADADGNETNLNNGTYTVLITENPSACTAAQTVSVNCNCPSIVVNGALSICQNTAATYTQTGGNAGGQWAVSPSGAGAVDANGNFVPSGGFSGAASISYAANGCTGNLSININPLTTPTFNPIPAFCSGTTAPSLPSTSNNGIAGTWSPTTVSNTTSGTYNFTPNAGQCASAASLSVTVDALPNLSVQTSCGAGLGTGNIATTANASAGGALSYTINGVADADGNQTSLNNGTYTVLITENPSTCTTAQTVSVNCNCPTISIAGAASICQNAAATYTQTGGNAGGQWSVSPSGAGTVDANGNFVPSGGFSGAASISYAANGCTGNLSININPLTTPTFTPIPAFCSGTTAPSLPNTSNNGITGTWSPTTISNTASGTYNFTPNAGQCASNASLSMTVNPSVTPTFNPIPAFCSGTAAPTLPSTSNNGIVGTWLPTVVSNTTSGTYNFTPNAGQCASAVAVTTTVNALPNLNVQTSCGAGLGTGSITTAANASAGGALSYTINGVADADGNQTNLNNGSYTVLITENPSNCTAAQTVSVNCNCPTITIAGALSICQNTAATYTQTGGNAGGQWSVSPSGAGTVDANGNFVPSGGFSGAASISYTANGCTGNLSININPLTTPTFNPIPAFCSGTAAPTLPNTSNNGIAGTWLPATISNTTSGTYSFTPNVGQCASVATVTTTVNALPNLSVTTSCGAGLGTGSIATTANASAGGVLSYAINGVADADGNETNLNNGTYTVLITENPSACTAAQTVSVNCNCPTITIAGALSICQNAAATYTQTGGIAGGQWSVSPSGAGAVDANGNFVPSGGFSGAASISYTANGCTGNLSININPLTTPTFNPIPAFCSGTAAPTLPSTSNNGIAGTWLPTTISNATSGTYNFTPNAGQCASVAAVTTTVNPSVTPTFTPIPAFCSGTAAPSLPSTSNNGIAGTWSPTTISNTTSGTYNFTPNAGQCASVASLSVTVNPSVTPTFTPILAFCSGTAAPSLPSTSNNGIAGTWLPTTISNTTSGTYAFTPNAGQCTSAAVVTTTVNALPNLNVQTSCGAGLGTGSIATTANTSAGGALSYAINGVADADGNQTNLNNGTYTVLITENPSACTAAQTVSVNCNCPTISIAGAASICQNAAATYTQTGGNAGGQWSVSPSGAGTVDANGNFVPSGGFSGAASISYAANGCTGNLSISINPLNTPTFTPIPAFCSGTAAPTLPSTSNNGVAGTWLPTVVSNTTSGTYNFTPNAGQCASAATVTTTVNALPNLSVTTSCGAGLGTGSIATTANASAGGALSYAINGVADADGNQTNLTNGTYTVLITENPSTCTTAQTVSVNCNCPTITIAGAASICQNTAATYTQTGGNAGGQWSVSPSGAGAVDANGNFVPSGGFSGAASISYAANGCTGNLSININPLTTPTFTPISAFCSGTAAPSLPSTSNNGIAGTWLPATVSNTASGNYNFTPNAGQCASAAAVTTTVNALPNLSVQTGCGAGLGTGNIATTANASAGGALSYAINSVADADGNETNLNNGTYTVLITENPSTCTAAQTVSVNCNCPSIVVNGALSICQNTAATYTQTGGNAGGQWSVNPSGAGAVDANGNFVPSGGFSGAASISYAANGCTGNLSININPLTTPTFTPIPAFCSGTAAPTLPSTSNNGIAGTWLPTVVSNTTSGTYNFTPNAGQCASAASLTVTVNALPNLSIVTDCGTNPSNGSGMLTITASVPDGSALEYAIDGVNFQASNVFSNLNNGAYIVTVRAISTSCIATASTNISCACIAPTLTVSSPNPICQNATGNATISLSNNIINTTGTPPTYYSTLALANAGGMGDVVNPDAVGAGTYFVRSNNATDSTCFSIEPINVVINNLPTASIEGMQNYCVGDAANALTANGGISYVWNNGTVGNTLIPSTNNANNTTYTVTVTDANTCQNTTEITVNVSEVSVILSGNTLIELGDSTTLHATAITLPNSTLSYTWLPTGLCQDADCSSITVSPNINSIYSVTVSNEWGCLATDNISLQVTTQNTLVIPNAFSPNGDNVNEVFHIGGTNIAQFELLIYDRWGQKTFETQSVDLADGWDGKYPNGIDAELAVYVYYLNVTFTDGKTQFAKGNVTLVR